jgi:hypothetical protein
MGQLLSGSSPQAKAGVAIALALAVLVAWIGSPDATYPEAAFEPVSAAAPSAHDDSGVFMGWPEPEVWDPDRTAWPMAEPGRARRAASLVAPPAVAAPPVRTASARVETVHSASPVRPVAERDLRERRPGSDPHARFSREFDLAQRFAAAGRLRSAERAERVANAQDAAAEPATRIPERASAIPESIAKSNPSAQSPHKPDSGPNRPAIPLKDNPLAVPLVVDKKPVLAKTTGKPHWPTITERWDREPGPGSPHPAIPGFPPWRDGLVPGAGKTLGSPFDEQPEEPLITLGTQNTGPSVDEIVDTGGPLGITGPDLAVVVAGPVPTTPPGKPSIGPLERTPWQAGSPGYSTPVFNALVPEPGSAWLLCGALIGLAAWRRSGQR